MPPDLLVPPPGSGFDGWFSRVWATFGRNWKPLVAINAITSALPALVLVALVGAVVFSPLGDDLRTFFEKSQQVSPPQADETIHLPDFPVGAFFLIWGLAMVGAIVIMISQAAGIAGSTWVITRQAAGLSTGVGAAIRYGATRMFGLWGWYLLAGLIVGIGLVLCILPGIYFGLALALFIPVYLFERANPIGRSWSMLHANFGPLLGRLAALLGAVLVVQVALSLFQQVFLLVAGRGFGQQLVIGVVSMVLSLPIAGILISGLTVTYAEQIARMYPVTAAQLAAQLGGDHSR